MVIQVHTLNEGYKYLHSRNITNATIQHFSLLYYDGKTLQGFPEILRQSWVNSVRDIFENTHYQQRFKHTIVIPVFDLYNKYVSIMVRQLENREPKFDAIPFEKQKLVFGLNSTVGNILQKQEVYITEGVFDFFMLWQAGVKHAVTANGCTLSSNQINLCGRFTKTFNVVFDPDQAGKMGTMKVKNLITKWGYSCSSIYLDKQCDLDEYIVQYGVQAFLKLNHGKTFVTSQKDSQLGSLTTT